MKRQRAPPKEREAGRMTAEVLRTQCAYQQGYADAIEYMRKKKEKQRQREQEKKARCWYFFKQKATGVAMLLITVFVVWTLEGDATIALLTAPLGLYLIFSRKMLIVNDYYFRTKERKKEWCRF